MPSTPLPCCAGAASTHVQELPHVHQFDFDLCQCTRCARYWVFAWREEQGGWEPVTLEDAARMQSLNGAELTAFVKSWATSFS